MPGFSTAGSPAPERPGGGPQRLQVASFIAAELNSKRLELGRDGKLPELRLEESQPAQDDVSRESSNPWLLIGVLTFSVVSSVVMLLVDTTVGRGEATSKTDARQEIQRAYLDTNDPHTSRPYQQHLRQALQAYARGDSELERRHYRDVSEMLRADNLHPLRGLTGDVSSDDRLNELLATLLRD